MGMGMGVSCGLVACSSMMEPLLLLLTATWADGVVRTFVLGASSLAGVVDCFSKMQRQHRPKLVLFVRRIVTACRH